MAQPDNCLNDVLLPMEESGVINVRTETSSLLHEQSVIFRSADKDSGGSSVATCTLNLVLSTVGVGALTMPWTTATLGWLQLSLLLLVVFLVSVYNLYLLDGTCRSLPPRSDWASYGGVVAAALGPSGAYALEAFMLLYSFGLLVSYIGVVGTELSTVASKLVGVHSGTGGWLYQSDTLMALAIVAVVLPLSLLPDASLRFSGALGTACMMFTTAVVMGSAPWRAPPVFLSPCASAPEVRPETASLEPVAWVSSITGLLSSVPMLTFCLNAATAFVAVRSQVQRGAGLEEGQPPRKRVATMIWAGQVVALLNYALCSAAGYLTFCGDVPDNVLNAYPASHLTSLAARLALTVQLSMACAGVYVPLARTSLWHLMQGLEAGAAPGGLTRCIMTVLLLAAVAAVAAVLDGMLALPLGLTSAVCTTAIMFVFPGLCYSRLHASAGMRAQCAPLLFALSGLAIGCASTTTLLIGAASGG